ncbi:MAG: hypothetical protein L0Z70_09785 [Chloroflexi bacterium]|nr:hypothetical protein [Chloroflexota bacterium]
MDESDYLSQYDLPEDMLDELPPDPPAKRRRGAQPGNTNAVSHGFYSRRLKKRDTAGVDDITITDLSAEIALFRIQIRRVVELSQGNDEPIFALAMLRALSIASHSLARLVTVQNLIHPPGSDMSNALTEAMNEVIEELGLRNRGR